MEKLIAFIKYYKIYIAILVLILIVFYIWYNLLFSVRTRNAVYQFEKKFSSFNDKIRRDFCKSSQFQNYSLADFYISSSYNPFLTGFLKYDYASLNMIKKVITYGARYIELEIFNKNISSDTVPVIGTGTESNQIIDTQNTLDCKDVFTVIRERVFSEKYIDNYTDPFFIFLNLKTKNNINTLNKLHDIIIDVFRDRLLDEKYSYQKVNIANTPMCQLMNKIIIFSSDGYKFSKLERLINLSTTSPNLNRIQYDDLPLNEDMLIIEQKPIVDLESKKIKLTKNFLYILDDTNFLNLNINTDFVIVIKSAANKENNTPKNTFLNIEKVSDRVIEFNDTINFKAEDPGDNVINIQFFSRKVVSNLNEKNKSSLTIVYTQNNIQSDNYDFMGPFMLGCQFVCMNFQDQDSNMEKYIKKFKSNSILPKPSNLRNNKDWTLNTFDNLGVSNNIQPNKYNKLSVLKDFLNNYTTVNILPFNTTVNTSCCVNKFPSNTEDNCSQHKTKLNCLSGTGGKCRFLEDVDKCNKNLIKIIVKKNNNQFVLALSPNFKNSNSFFDFENGLNRQEGSISIKFRNKYLVSDIKKEKCYLLFKDIPQDNKDDDSLTQFYNSASFYPVSPKCNKDAFVSFMQFIDGIEYYIKYRSEYDYKYKLYKKPINTSRIQFLGALTDPKSNLKLSMYEPKSEDGYKSIGTIFITGDDALSNLYNSNSFYLYKGATSQPIDFKLQKKMNDYYFWKTIPSTGFVSLGVIVTNTDKKPDLNNYCCISLEYLEKNPGFTEEQLLWNNSDIEQPLSVWNNMPYFKISTVYDKDNNKHVPPNEFVDIIYKIKDSNNYPTNVLEQLYLEKISNISEKEQNNTCFRIISEKIKQSNVTINEKMKQKLQKYNRKISLLANEDGLTNKCLGLKNIYWSKYFNSSNNNSVENYDQSGSVTTSSPTSITTSGPSIEDLKNSDLQLVDCKSNSYLGTNFDMVNDGTVRLSNNNDYCLTTSKKGVLELKLCTESKENQLFDYDSKTKQLKNRDSQKFLIYNTENDYIMMGNGGNKIKHEWIIDQSLTHKTTFEKNNLVLYKQLIPRGSFYELKTEKSNNTGKYNFLNEIIDTDNLHIYTMGVIKDVTEEDINVKFYVPLIGESSSSEMTFAKNTLELILLPKNTNSDIFKSKLTPGTRVLAKNKGINYRGFDNNSYLYWQATIINNDRIKENYVTILFSINSIEANLNRRSLGRPRTNNPMFVPISDLVLLK